MTSAWYPLGLQAIAEGLVDLSTDTLKVAYVDLTADYTYSAAHQFLSDITSYSGVTSPTLGSQTVAAGGILDGADISPGPAVTADAAKTVGALVVYQDTGVAGTSRLLLYIDGFPAVTPNGSTIGVTWDNGADKIGAI